MLIHHPYMEFGFVEIDVDVDPNEDVGLKANNIIRSLRAALGVSPQASAAPPAAASSQSHSGSGGGSQYPDRPDPRASDDERDAGNRKQIIAYCQEIAKRTGSNPEDVCFRYTEYQGRGGTKNPNRIATKRLYPIMKEMEKEIDAAPNNGVQGDRGGFQPPDDEEPPF